MPAKIRRISWSVLVLLVIASTFALIRALPASNRVESQARTEPQQSPQSQAPRSPARNLSLQPEAFNLSRRLGKRFSQGRRGQSVLAGTLTIGDRAKTVRIIRRQTDDSEQVEVVLAGASAALTWGADKGAGSPGESSKESGRDIIERLVFDSPDQFILAQVRGASYYTVGRNVRPEDAGDGYTGPLWNVIRVNDPEQDQQKRPRSPWRLYYINASTGLIDRIVSEIDGERTVAEISSWTEAKGEKIPAEIIWTQQGQVVMRYRVSNFSHE